MPHMRVQRPVSFFSAGGPHSRPRPTNAGVPHCSRYGQFPGSGAQPWSQKGLLMLLLLLLPLERALHHLTFCLHPSPPDVLLRLCRHRPSASSSALPSRGRKSSPSQAMPPRPCISRRRRRAPWSGSLMWFDPPPPLFYHRLGRGAKEVYFLPIS